MEKNEKKNAIILGTIIGILLAIFFVIFFMVVFGHEFFIDKFNVLVAKNRNSFWTGFFKVFTYLGSAITLAIISLVLLFVCKNKKIGLISVATLLFAGALNFLVKICVKRSRPETLMLIAESGYSFPSGHAIMTTAVFGILIYFSYRFIKNRPLKIFSIVGLVFLDLLVCFSRIYLGVHYTSDILAGFCLGVVIAIGFVGVFKLLENKKIRYIDS